ncbi:MAG: ComEC/Rec2 family competence protein [Planctomycetes bacterium]|nr:ComEC/Rec2 family competence protein [Planctomycetota bacterium]
MVPVPLQALVAATAWAVPTALLANACLPAAAALAAAGLLGALARGPRWRRAGLVALPVLLATLRGPAPPPAVVPAGPVRIAGCVRDVVRAPLTNSIDVTFDDDLRLRLAGDLDVVPGDRLRVLAMARPPSRPGAAPRLRGVPATADVQRGGWSFRRGCALLRRALERSLLELVPGEHGVMLATLVLGRATRPDAELTEAHRATGLSHLLAVSGAHAAMLAFLLGLTTRGRHLGAGRARTWFVLALLTVYGCLAGAEPPVLRAVIAYALVAVAARVGRPCGVATGLLVPALVTAAVEPAALAGPSFLLSYAAVIGLALALRGRRGDGPVGWLRDAVRASFWATLLTTPLTLWFFDQIAPWTILLTPVLAPLVAGMLLLGLVAAGLGLLAPALAAPFALPLQGLAAAYAATVRAADQLPGTPIAAGCEPPGWALALTGATGVAVLLARPSRRAVAALAASLAALWFVPLRPAPGPGFRLLAIGHGQAAIVTTASGAQVVVDCGSLHGGAFAARAVWSALARRTVDLLVVTHADQDHHNGIARLLTRVHVRHAVLPAGLAGSELHELLREAAAGCSLLPPGERLTRDAVTLFAPDAPAGASDNDRSLWLRARVGSLDVLLCGDAQELGVALALADGFASPADVLVLPHHGRANRNAPHLLARVRPSACLASAASGDGDTRLGALARRFGAALWVTGECGDLHLDGETRTVRSGQPPRVRAPPPR